MKNNKIFVLLLLITISIFCLLNRNNRHTEPVVKKIDPRLTKIQNILRSRNAPNVERLSNIYLTVPDSIRSIIMDIHYVESKYDSLAHSRTGDYGLGQINYSTWKEPKDSLLCADYNTRSTVDKYTKSLKYAHGDKLVALTIYNGSVEYLKCFEKLWNKDINLDVVREHRKKVWG